MCNAGPYCDECWPEEDVGLFCGGKCLRFYCMNCLDRRGRGMLYADDLRKNMYCQVECAHPGTKFMSRGYTSDEDGKDDSEDEDDGW